MTMYVSRNEIPFFLRINQLLFAYETFSKARESFIVANISRWGPVCLSYCCNKKTDVNKAWSRKLIAANHYISNKSRFKVVAMKWVYSKLFRTQCFFLVRLSDPFPIKNINIFRNQDFFPNQLSISFNIRTFSVDLWNTTLIILLHFVYYLA